jgi:hypothetical protein
MNTNKPQEFSMRKLFLFFISMIVPSLLHGMDRIVMDSVLSIDCCNAPGDAIISHCLSYDDHDTCRSIAMVSKAYNKIIEDNYRPTKKCIENFIRGKTTSVTGYKSWNKDFTKCAWVTFFDADSSFLKTLQLTLVDWNASTKHVTSSSRLWTEFHVPVFEDDVRPFFNKDGQACFYGYGRISVDKEVIVQNVIEYSIDVNGKDERYCCRFGIRDGQCSGYYLKNFATLFNFPILLKEFLKAEKIWKRCDDKSFYIESVSLTQDYKTFKKHAALEKWEKNCGTKFFSEYTEYDLLPKDVKEAIDEQYTCQDYDSTMEKIGIKNDAKNDI